MQIKHETFLTNIKQMIITLITNNKQNNVIIDLNNKF